MFTFNALSGYTTTKDYPIYFSLSDGIATSLYSLIVIVAEMPNIALGNYTFNVTYANISLISVTNDGWATLKLNTSLGGIPLLDTFDNTSFSIKVRNG